jgi:hypothetical protein
MKTSRVSTRQGRFCPHVAYADVSRCFPCSINLNGTLAPLDCNTSLRLSKKVLFPLAPDF